MIYPDITMTRDKEIGLPFSCTPFRRNKFPRRCLAMLKPIIGRSTGTTTFVLDQLRPTSGTGIRVSFLQGYYYKERQISREGKRKVWLDLGDELMLDR